MFTKHVHISNQCPVASIVFFILPRVLYRSILFLIGGVLAQVSGRSITRDPLQLRPPPVCRRLGEDKQPVSCVETQLRGERGEVIQGCGCSDARLTPAGSLTCSEPLPVKSHSATHSSGDASSSFFVSISTKFFRSISVAAYFNQTALNTNRC